VPPVHRNTDLRDCTAKTVVVGQSSVFVNNLLVSVKDDPNTHLKGELLATINPGTVFINNKEMVVQGSDAKPDKSGHTNPKAIQGSPNVFAFDGGSAGGSSFSLDDVQMSGASSGDGGGGAGGGGAGGGNADQDDIKDDEDEADKQQDDADSDDTSGDDTSSGGTPGNSDNLTYTNQNAIRNQSLDPALESDIATAVRDVYGPDARVEVYSGGQGETGRRTGSVRHNNGLAGDVYVYNNGQRLTSRTQLQPLADHWVNNGYGSAGLVMRGGGVHLDHWGGRGPALRSGMGLRWSY
jgi:hypothetical protein